VLSSLRIALIAVFITASYRLIPLPISDTLRAAILAISIVIFCNVRGKKLDVSFFREVWPLLALVIVISSLDILLGRIGVRTLIVWTKFATAMLVASAVFTIGLEGIWRLILVSTVILFAQLALISFYPAYFAATARDLGIVDPFVTHGRALDRVYYSYFNANAAAYAIYYFILSFLAVRRVANISASVSLLVVSSLILLAILTGGRGVIVLLLGFTVTWLASYKSTAAALFAGLLFIGPIIALPLYNATLDLIFLREESNAARIEAMQTYLGIIYENPTFGAGIQWLRERVEVQGMHPSHNFFLELLAMFGIPFGGILIGYLLYKMILCVQDRFIKIIGCFALLVGVFNNTLLANWGFFPLIVPILILADKELKGNTVRFCSDSLSMRRTW